MERLVAVVHCTLPCPDEGPACRSVDLCVTHRIWKQLLKAVMEVLDSVTLKDPTDEAKMLTPQEPSCVHGRPSACLHATGGRRATCCSL